MRPKNPHVRKRRFKHLAGVRYEVDFGIIGGKRLVKFFRTREAAVTFLREQKGRLAVHGETSLELSEPDRLHFQRERDRLAAVGATITEAVDFFLAARKPPRAAPALADALKRCVEAKRLAGAGERYLATFRCACRSFIAGRETLPVCDVTREMVRQWLFANGWEPKTQRGYFGAMRAFLAWAAAEDFVGENPLAGPRGFLPLPPIADREITAFDAEQCERLLSAALETEGERWDRRAQRWERGFLFRPLLAYVALAMFAGVRPEELQHSEASAVDTEHGTIVVTGKIAKTLRRRVVDLSENCVAWLGLWTTLCPGQTGIVPANFAKLWTRLRACAGLLEGWPHDVLRHTFATMHYATHKNAGRLKAELGHSANENTLERHYRALRTVSGRVLNVAEAARFWGIYPPPRITGF